MVVPSTPQGLEQLHASFRRETCLPIIQSALEAGKLKLIGWLPEVRLRMVLPEEVAHFDPHDLAFWDIHTPEEFRQAEELAGLEEN